MNFAQLGTNPRLDHVKALIESGLRNNPECLEQAFWDEQSHQQMTAFNRIIQIAEDTPEFFPVIDYMLGKIQNVNLGDPIHQAVKAGKVVLAKYLLESSERIDSFEGEDFAIDSRDAEGFTLIYLIIKNQILNLLELIIGQGVNLNNPSHSPELGYPIQPLHQAIELDFGAGVKLLAAHGAQLTNPVGSLRDTPLIQAAKCLKLDALAALLESPVADIGLELENLNHFDELSFGHTAIEELCECLLQNRDTSEAIEGISMLLCRGAEPPRTKAMRMALSNHRDELLSCITDYLQDKPDLVDPFVKRCHEHETSLHYIIYAENTWGAAVRKFFGVASDAALIVEDLVFSKYSNAENIKNGEEPLSTQAFAKYSPEDDPLKLYSAFVRLYQQHYSAKLFSNPWSTMKWKISSGNCDWNSVKNYVKTYPYSRTAQVYWEMFNKKEEVAPAPSI